MAQKQVLRWLRFRQMSSRHEDIATAHRTTFDWALNHDGRAKSKPKSGESGLRHWLRDGSGCYWIEGKARSRKTTFLKFLVNDHRNFEFLSHWAGEEALCVASFFFWNAGSSLQKRTKGLLRAILWQVLRNPPHLIQEVLPDVVEQCILDEADEEEPTGKSCLRL